MSKFKAGDKVETPFGVGIFERYVDGGFMSGSLRVCYEKVQTGGVYFWNEDDIKPYKTAHEKLIDMGYEFVKANNCVFYRHEELPKITIYNDKTYSCSDADLELSKILTQYLEELEND